MFVDYSLNMNKGNLPIAFALCNPMIQKAFWCVWWQYILSSCFNNAIGDTAEDLFSKDLWNNFSQAEFYFPSMIMLKCLMLWCMKFYILSIHQHFLTLGNITVVDFIFPFKWERAASLWFVSWNDTMKWEWVILFMKANS